MSIIPPEVAAAAPDPEVAAVAAAPPAVRRPRPTGLPERSEFVDAMLRSTTRRGSPVHSSFVQAPAGLKGENRGARLGQLVRSRSASYLDAFLLIQAMASSNPPYEVWFPAKSWVHALGLNSTTGIGDQKVSAAARSQWSKIIRRLVELNLIDRHRSSNKMNYVLLNESGDGSPYVRSRTVEQGAWFMIPHAYWTDGHYISMSLAAKAMLLVALSSKKGFELPFARTQEWYGLSTSTAKRGFSELEALGILSYDQDWRPEPKSKTTWAEVRTYRLHGVWSLSSRKSNISQRPPIAAIAPEIVFKEVESGSTAVPQVSPEEGPDAADLPIALTTPEVSFLAAKASPFGDFEAFMADMNKRNQKDKR
jgi:hypothetical protein